jgi:WD40 repeat protein
MDNLIRKKLQDLIAHRGQGLCLEPEQCKAAVKELCARHPVEQFVLVSMVDLGMLPRIVEMTEDWPDVAAELADRLASERSLNRDAARWGVETWGVALGKVDEAELRSLQSVPLGSTLGGMPLERRLLAMFIIGALYGLILWLVGWAVVRWGLWGVLPGAAVGAGLGLFRAVRDGVLSPWVIAAWALGGATGTLLFQGTDGRLIAPLTGAVACVLASAVGRALFVGFGERDGGSSLHVAALAGIVGPALAWPTAGLLTAAVSSEFDPPWSWALIGLCAGALQGALEEARRGWRYAVVLAILKAAAAGALALGAAFVSEDGRPLGWILTGAMLGLVPGLLFRSRDRHTQQVSCVAISPSGNFALSAGRDGNIGLWQLDERGLVGFVRQLGGPVHAVAFSHDGLSCASGAADGTVRLVDGNTGDQIFALSGHTGDVLAVAFSPADSTIASGGADGTIRLWDVKTGRESRCLQGHTGSVTNVSFSPDGGRIVSSSLDGTARIWDAAEGKEAARLDMGSPAHAAAFTPGARQIVTAADAGISLWDAPEARRLRSLGETGPVYGVVLSADGQRVLAACADGAVRLVNAASGEELACIRGHQGAVRSVALAPTSRFGLSGGDDGAVRLFGFPDSRLEDADSEPDEGDVGTD